MNNLNFSNVKSFVNNKSIDTILNERNEKNIAVKYNPELCLLSYNIKEDDIIVPNTFEYECNGQIFERKEDVISDIVAACQPKFIDIDKAQLLELCGEKNTLRFEYCEDGTLMRLYNYAGKWYTSTTRSIDAKDSYWASEKNFDEMFWEVFDKSLLEEMNPKYTYVFILLHRENRIVVKHNVNMLVYISRIDNTTLVEEFNNQFPNIYGIKRPTIIRNFDPSNVEHFYNKFKRGVLVKVFDKISNSWYTYKYDFEQYKLVKDARGNVPNIKMRYIELLQEPDKLKVLLDNYFESKYQFKLAQKDLEQLVKKTYKLYVDSHIKHEVQITDTDMSYRTLRQLHAQYKTQNRPINYDDVKNKIFSLDTHVIKTLLQW